MTATVAEIAARYIPAGADLDDPATVDRFFDELESRPLDGLAALEGWILDVEELRAAIGETGTSHHIAAALDTTDEAARAAHAGFLDRIQGPSARRFDALDRRLAGSPHRAALDPDRYAILLRQIDNRLAIYREENVDLLTAVEKEAQEYDRITGGLSVEWEGQTKTLPAMMVHLMDPDRALRERAWRLVTASRLARADDLDGLFDRLLARRREVAANAGFDDYMAYRFRELGRFDYTPDDCRRFHDAVEAVFVPLRRRLLDDRRERLAVGALRPWDVAVDPDQLPPLRPFEKAERLIDGCRQIFGRVDPELGAWFDHLDASGLLDLDNRPGKAPGGFAAEYPLRRLPFIFMNATGLDGDLRTLLHEGGHAFHSIACRDDPLTTYREPPIEFAEVASMGMELLAQPHLDVFYDEEARRRSIEDHLRRIVDVFVMTAAGDAFQAWLYTTDHDATARSARWTELQERFDPSVDWAGLEAERAVGWHRILHFFHIPFYFVEYAFAQIGALQIWAAARQDPDAAVQAYRRALALGGSRALPELFAAAGGRFAFDEATLRPLADGLEGALFGG